MKPRADGNSESKLLTGVANLATFPRPLERHLAAGGVIFGILGVTNDSCVSTLGPLAASWRDELDTSASKNKK